MQFFSRQPHLGKAAGHQRCRNGKSIPAFIVRQKPLLLGRTSAGHNLVGVIHAKRQFILAHIEGNFLVTIIYSRIN